MCFLAVVCWEGLQALQHEAEEKLLSRNFFPPAIKMSYGSSVEPGFLRPLGMRRRQDTGTTLDCFAWLSGKKT